MDNNELGTNLAEVGTDCISRQAAIDAFDGVKVDEENCTEYDIGYNDGIDFAISKLSVLPPARPTQLTDDDIETIRIHLSAFKENLCNQHRWNEAKEYEALIDRLTAQPEPCEDDPRADVYYLAEKIGIHQLYELVVKLHGESEPCEDAVSRKAVQYLLAHFVDEDKYVNACDGLKHLPPVTLKQPAIVDMIKTEIKRMKRTYTTCINSDYYTGYMSALSAVEGYIAKVEGVNDESN